jgi:hypothetical protein
MQADVVAGRELGGSVQGLSEQGVERRSHVREQLMGYSTVVTAKPMNFRVRTVDGTSTEVRSGDRRDWRCGGKSTKTQLLLRDLSNLER